MNPDEILKKLDDRARSAVRSNTLSTSGFVLFSGGIDSCILASLVSQYVLTDSWKLLTLGTLDSKDVEEAMKGPATCYALERVIIGLRKEQVEYSAHQVNRMVSVASISHFEDCLAFYLICEEANRRGAHDRMLLSANGPDELFCGYDRFRRIVDTEGYDAVDREISRALDVANNLRTQVRKIAEKFNQSIAEPFLEDKFVEFCREKIPPEQKILKGNDLVRKRIWREYGRYLGLSDEVALRPKKAMQYSMGIHRLVFSMQKRGDIVLQVSL